MKLDWIDPERGPTPEQLGAYADGQLCDADRSAIDAWLRRHPSRDVEVEALRNLTQLWRDTPPPQPSDEAWSTMGDQIAARLHERRTPGRGGETMPRRWSPRFGLAVAAAAVLALVLLSKGHTPPAAAEEELYLVVNADDVDILSIGGDACECLVAARPPVTHIDKCDLATQDDVLVLNLEPHWDGIQADPRFEDGAPMMFTPPAGWANEP
jgi:hypothetical protein